MGFWDRLLRRGVPTQVLQPQVTYLGSAEEMVHFLDPSGLPVPVLWRTQPHFRTVVEFVARNIAQLGLHTFERVNENDRKRDRGSVWASALARPNNSVTSYELKFALVGDLLLYDRAYWMVTETSKTPTGVMIQRLPPAWVEPIMDGPWDVKGYQVYNPGGNGKYLELPADSVLAFPGYSASVPWGSSPAVDSLRETLKEQMESAAYRRQTWKRGGRVSAVLERPLEAPEWSQEARDAFREDWYNSYTGNGPKAGGTPLLEDGMTLNRIDFSARDQQFVEASKLSLRTVAAAFHVNPTMVGDNEGANYANVREFRKMLYGDTLGPTIARVEDRINTFLIPRLGGSMDRHYAEFNIEEKLQGSFEEQVASLQAAVGGPWMTRDEARALRNLPSIRGGDVLITPLNVLTGGRSSPRDRDNSTGYASALPMSIKQEPLKIKADPLDDDIEYGRRLLQRFFKRQGDRVLANLGSNVEDWWDDDRWDEELSDDILAHISATSTKTAQQALIDLGLDPSRYNPDLVLGLLKALSKSRARWINESTKRQLEEALEEQARAAAAQEDPTKTPKGVYDNARDQRAEQSSQTLHTTVASVSAEEALVQTAIVGVTKTWLTTSDNPRPSHAAMHGETVPLRGTYSNGMQWPGDMVGADGDAGEIANCSCISEMTIPSSSDTL